MNADSPPKKIAVIGGGVVGAAVAETLRRGGHDVVWCGREPPERSTAAGSAGILACCACAPLAAPGIARRAAAMTVARDGPLFLRAAHLPRLTPWLFSFFAAARESRARRAAAALAPLLADAVAAHESLARGTPAASRIRRCDYLHLYPSRADFLADGFAWDLRRAHGFDGVELDRARLAAEMPGLGAAHNFGIKLSAHARIDDPQQYAGDLQRAFVAAGGRFLPVDIKDVAPRAGGARIAWQGGGEDCDFAVVAGGFASVDFARRLGHRMPLEAERGYHIDFLSPSFLPPFPMMVSSGKFVATPMTGFLRLAGLIEFAGAEAAMRKGPLALLRRGLRGLFPDLRFSAESEWMGRRPTSPDSLPFIGASRCPRILFAFGHQHIGLTAAPKTALLIREIIDGGAPSIPLAPFSPGRFDRGRRRGGDL